MFVEMSAALSASNSAAVSSAEAGAEASALPVIGSAIISAVVSATLPDTEAVDVSTVLSSAMVADVFTAGLFSFAAAGASVGCCSDYSCVCRLDCCC